MIVTVDFEAGHKKMIWAKKKRFRAQKVPFWAQKVPFWAQKVPFWAIRAMELRKTAIFTFCRKAENGPTNYFFQKRTPQIH